jgi:enoyl-CoA hydratase
MTSSIVSLEKRGHVLLMGLNRPEKRNAFTPDLIRELAKAYQYLAEDNELRCGVLWAAGEDFTSGLDMPAIAKAVPMIPFKPIIPRRAIDPWGVNTPPCPKPVVCAIQGRCFTLGIELALSSQITVASEKATFTQYEVSRGLFPFGGGTVRWAQSVGLNNAYRYMLTGDWFDAQEAYRLGLVQEVVPDGQQLARAIEIAEKISQQAPLGIQAILESTRGFFDHGATKTFMRIRWQMAKIALSKDLRRGIAAFKQRTTAQFKGN